MNTTSKKTQFSYLDEDAMSSASAPTGSATKVPTQQSVKAYVDTTAEGLHVLEACTLATTADLNYVYANGTAGVGATLTNGSTGVISIDGTALTVNIRILVKDQAGGDNDQNGIYKVTTAGAVDVALVLTREPDFDTYISSYEGDAADIRLGDFVFISSGAVNIGHGFVMTGNSKFKKLGDGVVGTDSIEFTQFSGLSETVAVNQGGTGATTLTDGGILLGSGTGAITAMAVLTDGQMIVGDGTTDPVAESGATLRASIGVAIGSDVQAFDADLSAIAGLTSAANKGIQFTGSGTAAVYDLTTAGKALLDDANAGAQRTTLGLGSLATASTINNSNWSGTDLSVANGGTGASTLTDGGILLGSGTGAITAMAVLTDGQMIVGDGTTDPVAESGATLRASIGVAIGSDVQAFDADLSAIAGLTSAANKGIQFTGSGTAAVYDLTTAGKALLDDANAGAQRTTLGLGSLATASTINNSNWSGTDLSVANGGTGLGSFTVGDILYASGSTTLAKLAKGSANQALTSNGTSNVPTWENFVDVCFLKGTTITLSDGSQKNIEEIETNDYLLSYEFKDLDNYNVDVEYLMNWYSKDLQGEASRTKVDKLWENDTEQYYIINDKLKVTPEHLLFISRNDKYEWYPTKNLKKGFYLLTSTNIFEKIETIELVEERTKVFNLKLDGIMNYYADDYLVHCSSKCDECENNK